MNEPVESLTARLRTPVGSMTVSTMLHEAADEIERLQRELDARLMALQAANSAVVLLQRSLAELREAALTVTQWDWSDNDEDCVRDMDRLRQVAER